MKNFFGPYLRKTHESKWHWMEKCPDFPGSTEVISMVSSKAVTFHEACHKCMHLEGEKFVNEERNYRSRNQIS